MNSQEMLLLLATLFLLVSLICSAVMLVTTFKKGDERGAHILSGACRSTVKWYAIFLILAFCYHTFLEKRTNFAVEGGAVLYLGVLAVIFTIFLLVNQRRYGGFS